MSAGRIVGTVVGALVGNFIPVVGWQIGAQIGGMLGDLVSPQKTPTTQGPRLSDLSVQTSTYGAPIPRVYGTITLAGNIIWLENNRLRERVKTSGGGKGGGKGGGARTRTYTYEATFAVALCQGPIVGVRRLWLGPNLVYDAGATDHETIRASNQAASLFTLYPGSDTQGPDPRIQATIGVAATPAWRGMAYLVIRDLPLAKYGNSLLGAQVKAEVVVSGTQTDWAATAQTVPMVLGSRVVWHRDKFVATEFDGKIWTSPTGETGTWTLRHDDALAGEFSLASNGEICIITRYMSPYVLSSYDGVTWVQRVVPDWFSSSALVDVVASERGFLATADCTGGVQWFALSPDGITWFPQAVPAPGWWFTPLWNGVVYVALILGGNDGIWTSPSGLEGTWTLTHTVVGTQYYRGCVLAGRFILGGNDASTLTSDDGITWTLHPSALPGGAEALSADGDVAICLHYGTFSVSTDGITWVDYPMSAAQSGWYGLAYNGAVWLATRDSGVAYTIRPRSVSTATTDLSDIVSAECLGSGVLNSGDIDVSSLTDAVRGYRIGSVGSLRSALEPLQAAWPFDIRQHGYGIEFVRRGSASAVVTIPQGDLDARPAGQAPGVQITLDREIDAQLPRRISVQYLDSDREYDPGVQYAERLNSTALNDTLLDLPIALNSAEAAGTAEVLLYLAWLNRSAVKFSLPSVYSYLEPADVVNLTTPDGVVALRLTAIEYTSDQRLDCQGQLDSPAIYLPAALGASGLGGETTIEAIGPSTLVLLDLPRISSAQDYPGLIVAMSGSNDSWPGGALLRSTDGGATYDQPLEVLPPGATLGYTAQAIGAVDERQVDTASRLVVTLSSGTLSSVSRLLLFGGANHFAYGEQGRWEILAAANCTLISGQTYALTDLLRGRYGSEWAMPLHLDGDRLIALDQDTLEYLPQDLSAIGLSRLYRGVTLSLDVSSGVLRETIYRGVQYKPLSPCRINGHRDPVSGDWSLFWVRRTRVGGEWRDSVDADLGEASESYWAEIYQDGTYAAIVRTIISSAEFAAYTSAQQITDFGSNQATLYLRIYQYSTTVGLGYPLTTEITR